ncbi:unnamed protein product [Didymodactylos carnosus]|uniref:Nose resistant-to-fluoxetine protein N-terminal domain-containing protein n=1 Tax=Didymodactylos carnosus TaxID=1234261 RepID=A0A814CRY6_9BILA|nr:unnamed protein product [Didymodactylos carnosus]CAF0946030.1 unnamed protein product [Didymodactylos carnosus]CAF3497679.1 unnamed protein product [Didymodactylos carnosus]CAF3722188.1 unnamed protein product [Didymodactylos carnosus]
MKFNGKIFSLKLVLNINQVLSRNIQIISNVRYIEEELIYSNNIYSTFPNLTLDLTSSSYGNLTQCRQDVNLLTRDFLTLKRWALKTMDAWGKVPSGVLFGDLYWIGSSYECSHHLSQFNRSIIEQPFYTKQCIIGLRTELSGGYSLAMAPLYGVCVPESCNSTDVIELINNRLIIVPTRFKLSNDSIHCIEKRSLSPVAILTIILLCCLFLLILLATGMHIFYGRHVIKINQPPVIETSATVHTDIEDENYEEENERSINTTNPNEVTPLIIRRTNHSSVDSAAQNLIERCSLVNNYNDLLHKTSPANLACLNGIRVLSMFWIILGHTILFGAFYSIACANHSNSTSYFEDVYIKPWCRVAPYAVGLIVGYMLYTMNQRKISSWDFSSVQSRLVQETEKRYRSRQIFLWIFALVILLLCLFGTYGDYAHSTSFKPLTRSGRISFLVLSRLAWAIGLSVLILACFTGHGGIIDRFLSCSVIQKLSKLTYGAYLWHPLVIAVSILGRDLPLHYSGANIVCR